MMPDEPRAHKRSAREDASRDGHRPSAVSLRARGRRSARWIDGWFLAFALYSAVVTGLIPILLPIEMHQDGEAMRIGLVMAALTLGGLSAPFAGRFADRSGLHREIMAGGMIAAAALILVFSATDSLWAHVMAALGVGAASGACATMANLFIVEVYEPEEWDQRIGWLQTFYGLGWVLGLLMASLITGLTEGDGFLVAAMIMALAGLLAWWRSSPIHAPTRPPLSLPSRAGDWFHGDPSRHYHLVSPRSLFREHAARLDPRSPFGLFLASWGLMFLGAALVFAVYPVIMEDLYGIPPGASSFTYAVAAFVAIFLYSPAGRWSESAGTPRVYRRGLWLRLLPLLVMAAMVATQNPFESQIAALASMLIVIAWPLLSVSGTALVAQLFEGPKGTGMGVFNAATALSGALGAGLSGWLTQRVHEGIAPIAGAIAIGLGLLVALRLQEGEPAPSAGSRDDHPRPRIAPEELAG